MINPSEPCSAFADSSNNDEVVSISSWAFNPKLEARILEFEQVIKLDLIEPWHITADNITQLSKLLIWRRDSLLFLRRLFLFLFLGLLWHHFDLSKQSVVIFHHVTVEKDEYFRLQEGHKVFAFYELGIQVIGPFDSNLLTYFLDAVQLDGIDTIGSL